MQCRSGCGACCIAPSITSAIPSMPQGKPAGIPCVHLSTDFMCAIFTHPDRPKVCAEFRAEHAVCGDTREQALAIITELESITLVPYVADNMD